MRRAILSLAILVGCEADSREPITGGTTGEGQSDTGDPVSEPDLRPEVGPGCADSLACHKACRYEISAVLYGCGCQCGADSVELQCGNNTNECRMRMLAMEACIERNCDPADRYASEIDVPYVLGCLAQECSVIAVCEQKLLECESDGTSEEPEPVLDCDPGTFGGTLRAGCPCSSGGCATGAECIGGLCTPNATCSYTADFRGKDCHSPKLCVRNDQYCDEFSNDSGVCEGTCR